MINIEEYEGRVSTNSFVPMKKERRAYDGERSKSKEKKKDWSKARERKRSYE